MEWQGKKLTNEELVMGAVVPLAFVSVLKWWIVITLPVCALLWAYAGAEGTSKGWRRVGVPVTLAVALSLITSTPWILASALPAWAVLSLGYGIPDETDEGSRLGRFWMKVTNGNHELSDVLVRGTIGLLLGLSYFTLVGAGHTLEWVCASIALMILFPVVEEVVK